MKQQLLMRKLSLKPNAEAQYKWATLQEQGKLDEAIEAYQKVPF